MKNFLYKKVIFWDFDGVLMDSMPIRNKGFEMVLKDFPKEQVDLLMEFHERNGGLSRYVKFRYFFEEIRNENISEPEIKVWASKFSEVMRVELVDKALLINDSLEFIRKNIDTFKMHIVSGSDQEELRFICESLKIDPYFVSINGSPTPKNDLVKKLLQRYNYRPEETVLIGDSLNDLEAAKVNNLDFYGYNNTGLKEISEKYISKFTS